MDYRLSANRSPYFFLSVFLSLSRLNRFRNLKQTNPDVEDVALSQNSAVEREWLPFIVDNLLAYIVIFQQLLPRFTRVDLISPKMAIMLYRITKVGKKSEEVIIEKT